MDRLRSENGCPWDARQTHESLSEYLLEETYETLAAIEQGETAELVEELGDLLLQVVFHARLGQEESPGWNIDDVASGISDKLIRRHPHVFANTSDGGPVSDSFHADDSGAREPERSPVDLEQPQDAEDPQDLEQPTSPEQLSRNWTRAKAAEKGRSSALDGIPRAMPALAQAQKTWRRALESGVVPSAPEPTHDLGGQNQFGEALLRLVVMAEKSGVDAEAALRGAIANMRLEIVELESLVQPGEAARNHSG